VNGLNFGSSPFNGRNYGSPTFSGAYICGSLCESFSGVGAASANCTLGAEIPNPSFVACGVFSGSAAGATNPVFAPWTSNEGGGPPVLWEFEGHLFTNRWIESNVDFLKATLAVSHVTDVLKRAVERLTGQQEHDPSEVIRDDVPMCIEALEARCSERPQLLSTSQEPGNLLEWSR
jgi:hypothetical protein